MLTLTVLLLAGYLLGSIPTAVIVSRSVGGFDIRSRGSGNAGASNVLRTLGAMPALLVLALDVAKGWGAAELGHRFRWDALPVDDVWAPLVASIAVVLGHVWPLFARFRGGKGVATAAGVLLALDPLLLAVATGLFVVVVVISRRISPASITAAASLPIALVVLQAVREQPVSDAWLGFNLWLALLIVFTHRANIRRLLDGTEPQIG